MTQVDLDFAPAAYSGAREIVDVRDGHVRVVALFDGYGSWGYPLDGTAFRLHGPYLASNRGLHGSIPPRSGFRDSECGPGSAPTPC